MIVNGGPINAAPINAAHGEPFIDWAADLDPLTTQVYYACDIDDGVLDPLRAPISSWQATLQRDRSDFLQAVIPAADAWVSAIASRATNGEIIIYKGARLSDGTVQESELARAPLQVSRLQRGPNRTTLTVSGYGKGAPATPAMRTLRNVRSVTVDPNIRIRCDIDWFLRPGQTARTDDYQFVVAYINYYANANDEYMDVGERAL